MRIVKNHKLIRRNGRIGQYSTLAALVILGIGMYLTFASPENFSYSLIALALGFILSQMGMYFSNRWGRSPRPDEVLEKGLKGLGRDYTIYHYVTPVSHLLVGPAGIWVLLPLYQKGTITFEKGRWRQRGAGFVQNYLKIFGQDTIGRPERDASGEIDLLKRFFARTLPEMDIPSIQAAALFVHPLVELKAEGAPLVAMIPRDFKEYLRTNREILLSSTTLDAIRKALPQLDRTDE
ncbi:MAG: hypothetical protein FJZ96_06320 [Chloroflexi bacterium]|nr:hypothetical protein [Chloroflexota bacterium]